MKKILTLILGFALLPPLALASEEANEKPTPEDYEAAAGVASTEFICLFPGEDLEEEKAFWKVISYAFIKNPKRQRFISTCLLGSIVYILREENPPSGERRIRAGIFLLGENKRYLERKGHDFSVVCDLNDPSQYSSRLLRADYLCYNPTVAAGSTQGEEFSFRIGKKRKSFRRDCTVFFGGPKTKECGKWEQIK